jgi:glycosyltransferase involved in cell wall biosynthesis
VKDIKWVIVGDGRKRAEAEQQVKDLGIEDTVSFLGRYPLVEMPSFFVHADAMLVSLKDEYIFSLTIPAKTQAYMASGKPILTMINGVGNDVVNEAKCGLTANAGDYKQLADNVLKMYNMDKSALDEMGVNAETYYRTHFDKDEIIDRMLKYN